MIKKIFPRYQVWDFENLWTRFVEWRIRKQSEKFSKELKKKNYKPREPWDVGIWK